MQNHVQNLGKPYPKWPSSRFMLSFMGFTGFVLLYAMRINLNIAIVDMVKQAPSHVLDPAQSSAGECPVPEEAGEKQEGKSATHAQFDWTEYEVAQVVGAFYYGYILTQIVGGYLATIYGGKYVYLAGVLITSVLTVITPWAAYQGPYVLCYVRFLEGLFEAVTFPAFNAMMGKWVPAFEKSVFSALTLSGGTFGNIIAQPLMGYLCSLDYMGGWPIGFYLIGFAGIVHAFFWHKLVFSSPYEHPFIDPDELEFIKRSTHPPIAISMPWKKALTSLPVWATSIGHASGSWSTYAMMNCLPQYLSNVLHYDISSNGVICAMPWLFCWIVIQIVSNWTDRIRRDRVMTTTTVRKVNMFFGSFFPAFFMILAAYSGCNATAAVFCITVGMTFLGFLNSAYNCNHLDLAPQVAGTLFGLTNTIATAPGFVAPLAAEYFTSSNPHSMVLWQNFFLLTAAVQVFGGVFFCLFASGEQQSWATGTETSEMKKYDVSVKA